MEDNHFRERERERERAYYESDAVERRADDRLCGGRVGVEEVERLAEPVLLRERELARRVEAIGALVPPARALVLQHALERDTPRLCGHSRLEHHFAEHFRRVRHPACTHHTRKEFMNSIAIL